MAAGSVSVGNLKNIRVSQGYSQTDLARRIGMSSPAISTMEKKGSTSRNTAEAIARALGVSTDNLKEGPVYRHGKPEDPNGKKYPPVKVGNEYSYFNDSDRKPTILESEDVAFVPVDNSNGSKATLETDSMRVTLSFDKNELRSLIREAVAEGVASGLAREFDGNENTSRVGSLLEEIATKP